MKKSTTTNPIKNSSRHKAKFEVIIYRNNTIQLTIYIIFVLDINGKSELISSLHIHICQCSSNLSYIRDNWGENYSHGNIQMR